MKFTALPMALVLSLASAAAAHDGVTDPNVMARMSLMDDIRLNMAALGGMARGRIAFDADKAQKAQDKLAALSAKIPAVFQAQSDDPVSESSPKVWSDWDGFTAQAVAMEAAAKGMDVSSLDQLKATMGPLGGSCSSCHRAYRVKK